MGFGRNSRTAIRTTFAVSEVVANILLDLSVLSVFWRILLGRGFPF